MLWVCLAQNRGMFQAVVNVVMKIVVVRIAGNLCNICATVSSSRNTELQWNYLVNKLC